MRKQIDLDDQLIDVLKKEAVDSGHGNFKNYVEDLLTKQAKKSKYYSDDRAGFTQDGYRYYVVDSDEIVRYEMTSPYDLQTRRYIAHLYKDQALIKWKEDKDIITKL